MKFSIIIPAYNAEKYLGECLKSLEAQTFQDFEIVIVDDGSKDGTGEIADVFTTSFMMFAYCTRPTRVLF